MMHSCQHSIRRFCDTPAKTGLFAHRLQLVFHIVQLAAAPALREPASSSQHPRNVAGRCWIRHRAGDIGIGIRRNNNYRDPPANRFPTGAQRYHQLRMFPWHNAAPERMDPSRVPVPHAPHRRPTPFSIDPSPIPPPKNCYFNAVFWDGRPHLKPIPPNTVRSEGVRTPPKTTINARHFGRGRRAMTEVHPSVGQGEYKNGAAHGLRV